MKLAVKINLTVLALLAFSQSAHAGFVTYSYTGSSFGLPTSSMTGSFQVAETAIADGTISLDEIKNISFILAVDGYANSTFNVIESFTGGPITVDAQGYPTSANVLSFSPINDPFHDIGVLSAKVNFNAAGTFPTDGYSAVYADSGGIVFSLGGDENGPNWTVTFSPGPLPVPEPSSLVMVGAGIVGLAIVRLKT